MKLLNFNCFYFLSNRLNYLIAEFQPHVYHVTNVLLHVLATGLFAVFAKALTPHSPIARTAAPLLFAAHPVHSEAVAGVVGRADVGAAIFFLGSVLAYMRYCGGRCSFTQVGVRSPSVSATGGRLWLGVSLGSAALSMLTKEHGVTVIAVCAAYHIFVHARLKLRDLPALILEVSFNIQNIFNFIEIRL